MPKIVYYWQEIVVPSIGTDHFPYLDNFFYLLAYWALLAGGQSNAVLAGCNGSIWIHNPISEIGRRFNDHMMKI